MGGEYLTILLMTSGIVELEKRLEEAQHEIDQLELQVVPAELQDIHQALFSATQNLEETKRNNEKLTADLAEANVNVVRAQEDSSQLLIKISQLQDTIAYVDILRNAQVMKYGIDDCNVVLNLSFVSFSFFNQNRNHLRDNNALKETLKEHEKCQENTEAVSLQHKKDLENLQASLQAALSSFCRSKPGIWPLTFVFSVELVL